MAPIRFSAKRHTVLAALAVYLAAALQSAPVNAQGGINGSIVGYVFDQTGAPIKGVKVAAKSDTQIGGAKVVYTNDDGYVRIVGLLPGVFEIAATAPKLKGVVQKGVTVGIGAPAEISLVMEVETNVEEVKVVEKAPIVSTTTATVKETLDYDFLDALPQDARLDMGRTMVESFAGGQKRGNAWGFRGGGNVQTAWNVEGFIINGMPSAIGSLAAGELSTAGYGAEHAAAPGAVVNFVTKSGSNKYLLDVSGFFEDSSLRFFTDASDIEARNYTYYLNPAVSGPIVKDRLWFYANAEVRDSISGREKDTTGRLGDPPAASTLDLRTTFKLTWQATPRNKLTSFNMVHFADRKNQGTVGQTAPEALALEVRKAFFAGLIWESLLSDNLFLRSQVAFQRQAIIDAPERCRTDPENCDHIRQERNTEPQLLLFANSGTHTQDVTRGVELVNQLEWFAHSKIFGEHSFKAKSRAFIQSWELAQSTPGDGWVELSGTTPIREQTVFANDPRLEEPRYGWRFRANRSLTTVHSVQDAMRLTRYLTFTPGVAYSQARVQNVGQDLDLNTGAFTPHLSAAWDATHDGRTVLRGSFNQYVDPDIARIARFTLGQPVNRLCLWDDQAGTFTRNCTWGGGPGRNTIGLPCGAAGTNIDGTPCKDKLRIPRTWEYTAGAEREIVQGVGLGADLIYRLFTHQYEAIETNRIWRPSGYRVEPTGGFRNGRSETIFDQGTPTDTRRRYVAVTASLRKREGPVRVNASYTWARQEGNVQRNEQGDYGNNPARDFYYAYGFLSDDYRHAIRATATWQTTRWLSTGYIVRYRSGAPYQRFYRNDELANMTDYRAPVGTNPGANINDPSDDTALRLPDLLEMNLQVRINFKPLTGIDLDAYVDTLNILAARTTTSVTQTDGATWGQTLERLPPMRMRVGFRYRY